MYNTSIYMYVCDRAFNYNVVIIKCPWPCTKAPPNGRGPMIFYAQNAKFSQFFFARFARDTLQA